jgi:hypothetical protein
MNDRKLVRHSSTTECDPSRTSDQCIANEVQTYAQRVGDRVNFAQGRIYPTLPVSASAGADIYKSEGKNVRFRIYPVSVNTTKAYDMTLGVSGSIDCDSKKKASQELTVILNKDVFDRAVAVEEKYKNGETYHLAVNDCTTFVAQVEAQIPGLKSRTGPFTFIPQAFFRRSMTRTDNNWRAVDRGLAFRGSNHGR